MLLETGLEVGNRLCGPVQIELTTEGRALFYFRTGHVVLAWFLILVSHPRMAWVSHEDKKLDERCFTNSL